LAYQNRVVELH